MGHDLGWPWGGSALVAVAAYLPWAGLLVAWLRRPEAGGRERAGVVNGTLLVGGWVLLQVLAMAYARGADGRGAPASRYLDLLAAGAAVNALAAWLLADGIRPRGLALLAATVWTLGLVVGLGRQAVADFRTALPAKRDSLRLQEANVRALLADGDVAAWRDQPMFALPFPDAEILATYLRDPTIGAALPAVIRPPSASRKVGPWSRGVDWLLRHGGWIFVVGVVGLAGTVGKRLKDEG